ncbi:glycosyltransferase family 39 protein [Pelagicoccus sp. SDUM812005]|nr:glycosyltransferase family 39 protein [Pelagicoccus sp. SDUM812005]
MIIRLIALILIATASLLFALFYPSAENTPNLFINFGYLNIALLTGVSLAVLLHTYWRPLLNWTKRRNSQILLIVCTLASVYLYTRHGGGFKIAFDEYVLTNVSMNLHQYHVPVISESPLYSFSRLELLDKRPLLFPFLLSLTHDILGYSSSNGFYLNAVLTFLLLLLIGVIVQKISSLRPALIAIGLACFTPLIAINSSGSGFDILNVVCVLLAVLCGIRYWEEPDAQKLGSLAFVGVLASQVRYETVLVAIPIAVLILANWVRQKQISLSWVTCFAPIFFIPLIWQQRAVAENPERYQYAMESGTLFSVEHISPNLQSAFKFLFIPSDLYPGSPFIGFLGAAGLLIIFAFSGTRFSELYKGQPARLALLIFLLYLIPLCLIHAFFFYGKFDDPIVSRLALPLTICFIIAGSLLLGRIHIASKKSAYLCYTLMAATGLYASKQYANPRYKDSNTLQKRIDWALTFAEELPPGQYLFISPMPLVFENEHYNAIHTSRAKLSLEKLAKQREFKTYREIFVLENFLLEFEGDNLVSHHLRSNDLGPAVELETVAENSFSLYNFTRISRVTDIDLGKVASAEEQDRFNSDKTSSTQLKTPNQEETDIWMKSLL